MNDVLIYSKTRKEHIKHIRKVLQLCREHNLYIKLEKYIFYKKEVKFLEYIVIKEGVKISKDKVQMVLDQPKPTTKKKIQAFIGFANYYKRFIQNFEEEVRHITMLTKKDTLFKQTGEADTAFKEIKKRFIKESIL